MSFHAPGSPKGGKAVSVDNLPKQQQKQGRKAGEIFDEGKYSGNDFSNSGSSAADLYGSSSTPKQPVTSRGYTSTDSSLSDQTKSGYSTENFLNTYINKNFEFQNKQDEHYKNTGTFDYSGDESRAFNPLAMQERIDNSSLISRDRSKVMFGNLFGDMDRFKEAMPDWVMPKPGKPIESDADEIAEDYADRLD